MEPPITDTPNSRHPPKVDVPTAIPVDAIHLQLPNSGQPPITDKGRGFVGGVGNSVRASGGRFRNYDYSKSTAPYYACIVYVRRNVNCFAG